MNSHLKHDSRKCIAVIALTIITVGTAPNMHHVLEAILIAAMLLIASITITVYMWQSKRNIKPEKTNDSKNNFQNNQPRVNDYIRTS